MFPCVYAPAGLARVTLNELVFLVYCGFYRGHLGISCLGTFHRMPILQLRSRYVQ
jgi:hypothetical protein